MAEDDVEDKKKSHRQRHSGRKAEKKKQKIDNNQELSEKQRNPKAFAFNSAVRAERRFRRTQDLKSKKEHIPVVDRTPLEPPPILVAVVGPAKVGKSTLIKCLIKSYTRQPLTTIKGPVTVVSGKKRRITLVECNNDINSMVDIAKVVDLVLLLIDASFGFEMEIFEFLNICQVHGMPKIMGVLTHLDMIKQTKKLQRTKKTLKRRFWTEVYAGAKLFYLSGILHGEYLKNEIKNLARFISVMKFRPLVWQTSHPYFLADRMEDLTPPESIRQNPKVDRTVSIYGYMRGIAMNKNCFIHIPGCGDFSLDDICFLSDPCPLPEQLKKRSLIEKERLVYAPFSGVGGIVYDKDAVYIETTNFNNNNQTPRPGEEIFSSILENKETIDTQLARSTLQLFSGSEPITSAQFINEQDNHTGGIIPNRNDVSVDSKKRKQLLDSDGEDSDMSDEENYSEDDNDIDDDNKESSNFITEDEQFFKTANEREEVAKFRAVQSETDKKIREKISTALAVLEAKDNSKDLEEWSECSSSDEDLAEDSNLETGNGLPWDERNCDSESDNTDDDLPDTDLNWKSNLAQKAALAFIERQSSTNNLSKLVYGGQSITSLQDVKSQEDDLGGLFKVVSRKNDEIVQSKDKMDAIDCSKFVVTQIRNWDLEKNQESIRDCFVTGKWKQGEDASALLKLDDMSLSEDEEVYGDWEDLETGERHEASLTTKEVKEDKNLTENLTKEQLLEKKKKLKEKFNQEYDTKDEVTYFDELKNEANKQAELNRSQFEGMDDSVRVQLEGFRAGMYVRIEINKAPCEMVEHFDPSYPLIVGGLQPGEQNVGYVKVRIKKHRWYHKILKSRDPLIISMGWRRFQTVAVYSKQEDNMRHRMLKYTPEHVSCMAHFWGPMTRATTGFLAIQSADNKQIGPGFRVVATGSVVDTNQSTAVTKKLKLIGTPLKIYKKTAFIQGMFTSALEVAKFEGAKIKTVSGIRGQIKKAANKPEGTFRATFEDKILLSDIIFCRTWYRIDIPKLYIPVTSLLLPPDQKNSWMGMKTVGQLKREKGLRYDAQPDSMYKEIKREVRVARPLVVPRALEKELPYKYKTKPKPVVATQNQSRKKNLTGAFMAKARKIVVRDEYESKVSSLMDKLRTSFEAKQDKMKETMHKKMTQYQKQFRAEEARKLQKQREMKKNIFRTLSKLDAKEKKLESRRHKK